MSSVDNTLNSLKNFFSEQIQQYGANAKGVDWKSQEAQYLRFDQLLKLHTDLKVPFSILDYGSGYGALIQYLIERGYQFTYTGYDMNEAAIEEGSKLFAGMNNVTLTTDEANLRPADYCIGSGLFNMKLETPQDEWEAYMLRTIERLWMLSSKGMAFNSLTKYSDADKMRADLYYADPCWLFDYCKTKLSKQVALLHDYGIHDFTMLVRR
jgi:SAM-dependent methyltransferase